MSAIEARRAGVEGQRGRRQGAGRGAIYEHLLQHEWMADSFLYGTVWDGVTGWMAGWFGSDNSAFLDEGFIVKRLPCYQDVHMSGGSSSWGVLLLLLSCCRE
jgi:hypothetical protein